jgi:hypothetical protein
MASETQKRRLEALAAQAHARSAELAAELEPRRGLPAGPGDLFVLRATADLPVEWAVLDRGAGGKLLAVPADSGLPAGTADVEVPANSPGGPLSLRCRYGVWLDEAAFEPDLRSGALAPETVAQALRRVHQIESGTLTGSPLAEEVDADPEYADWIRDVPERARELAAAIRPIRRSSARPWGMAHRLAASFALVAVGLSLWVGLLLRRVEQLSTPIFNAPSEEVVLGGDVRGRTILQVPREASHVNLVLSLGSAIKPQNGYLEIIDRSGRLVWQSPRVRLTPETKLSVTLSRRLLPYGDYLVRALPEAGSGAPPLAKETLRVQPSE